MSPPPHPDRVPAGAYDIFGPETTTYRDLLVAYARATGKRRAGFPFRGLDTGILSWMTAVALPVPGGLAADLVESLDHPMMASDDGLRDIVPDPPGGLLGIDDAIARALSSRRPRPVNALADPHHLADTDPTVGRGRHAAHRATGPLVTLRSRARCLVFSASCPARSPARCEPDWTR